MGVKCMCYTKILYDNFQSMPSVNTIMIARPKGVLPKAARPKGGLFR